MPPIVESIEVGRPPEVVFSYATDPAHFADWQQGVVRAEALGAGPAAVGGRCRTTRLIGGSERVTTQEITELAPPRRWAIRGIDGPIRANVGVTVEPLGDGERSRVTLSIELEGHGVGRMIVPAIRREVAKQAPNSCRALKERLELDGQSPA
jgi:uncharacterized protein YndB with AHSA1/START domain